MAWVTLSVADVRTRLTTAELSAIQSIHAAAGDTAFLTSIITQVVDEVRGYVAAAPGGKLGEGTTVPSKLVGAALSLIRYRTINSLPSSTLMTEARKEEYKDALALLERVSDGKFAVEEPTTVEDEGTQRGGPKMTSKTRTWTRADQEGL